MYIDFPSNVVARTGARWRYVGSGPPAALECKAEVELAAATGRCARISDISGKFSSSIQERVDPTYD